jgi:ABC-type phosphate transport system permease subunit
MFVMFLSVSFLSSNTIFGLLTLYVMKLPMIPTTNRIKAMKKYI